MEQENVKNLKMFGLKEVAEETSHIRPNSSNYVYLKIGTMLWTMKLLFIF